MPKQIDYHKLEGLKKRFHEAHKALKSDFIADHGSHLPNEEALVAALMVTIFDLWREDDADHVQNS